MGATGYPIGGPGPQSVQDVVDGYRSRPDFIRARAVAGPDGRWQVWAVLNLPKHGPVACLSLCWAEDGLFWVKLMDESMGPQFWGFPKEWLCLLNPEPPNVWAERWRDRISPAWRESITEAQAASGREGWKEVTA